MVCIECLDMALNWYLLQTNKSLSKHKAKWVQQSNRVVIILAKQLQSATFRIRNPIAESDKKNNTAKSGKFFIACIPIINQLIWQDLLIINSNLKLNKKRSRMEVRGDIFSEISKKWQQLYGNSFKNAYDKCHQDMNNESWWSCQSIKYQVSFAQPWKSARLRLRNSLHKMTWPIIAQLTLRLTHIFLAFRIN